MNNVNTPSVQSFNCYHVLFERCSFSLFASIYFSILSCPLFPCMCVWHLCLLPRCIHLRSAKFYVAHTTHWSRIVLVCMYVCMGHAMMVYSMVCVPTEWLAAAEKFPFCICASRLSSSVISLPQLEYLDFGGIFNPRFIFCTSENKNYFLNQTPLLRDLKRAFEFKSFIVCFKNRLILRSNNIFCYFLKTVGLLTSLFTFWKDFVGKKGGKQE